VDAALDARECVGGFVAGSRQTSLLANGAVDDATADLMVRTAWLYYVEKLTQVQIASAMRVSRARVIQLLRDAHQSKIVTIHIANPGYNCLSREKERVARMRLRDAIVIPTPPDRVRLEAALGKGAAQYLDRTLDDGDVVGTAWGTTMFELAKELSPASRRDISVVLLLGGLMSTLEGMNPNEIARLLAEAFGGKYYGIYVPAIVDSKRSRDVIVADKSMRETLQLARSANKAVVGIGTTTEAATLLRAGFVSLTKITELRGRGAVGDVLARYFDIQGRLVESDLNERIIGSSLDDLRGIETVIAVAGGTDKVKPIVGAVRGGFIDVLVTDEMTARAALAVFDSEEPAAPRSSTEAQA
jgi:DNA-binding transcriptional regulator LsrR (DeoR family)